MLGWHRVEALAPLLHVLAPLVEADGGEMYLVEASTEDVHIHLAGTCAGCPGSSLTRDRVFAPALAAAFPKAKLRVTTGVRIPAGAKRVEAPAAPATASRAATGGPPKSGPPG